MLNNLKEWLAKQYRSLKPPPSPYCFSRQLMIAAGSTITFYLLYFANQFLGQNDLLLLVPLLASALMVFTMPSKATTSPIIIFQAYILCALIGLAFVYTVNDKVLALISCFCLCAALMWMLDCIHPPAVILPLLLISEQLHNYHLALNPIAIDVLILAGSSYIFEGILKKMPIYIK